MVSITSLQKEAHDTAVEKGWWDSTPPTFGECIALAHSELSEALEEWRISKSCMQFYTGNDKKPCGIPSELADCVIRIMDMCEYFEIDLEEAIIEKMQYNKTRPYRHGNKVL